MTRNSELRDTDSHPDIVHALHPQSTLLQLLVGRATDASGDNSAYEDEKFVAWITREAHERLSLAERRSNERAAALLAEQARERLRARRIGEMLQIRELRARDASVVGGVGQVADVAAASGCAPWLTDLAVAAGVGRELWDEPCERWVELPRDAARGRYIVLGVAGDSMTPHMQNGDAILVDLTARLARDAIVVARRPDCGYVVKYVSRLGRSTIELSSFNSEYEPFTIARDANSIIGIVAARLTHTQPR